MDGDLSVSFPKSTASTPTSSNASSTSPKTPQELATCRENEASLVDGHEECGSAGKTLVDQANRTIEDEDEDVDDQFNRHVAWKFLLAGGVAGAGETIFGFVVYSKLNMPPGFLQYRERLLRLSIV